MKMGLKQKRVLGGKKEMRENMPRRALGRPTSDYLLRIIGGQRNKIKAYSRSTLRRRGLYWKEKTKVRGATR